MKKTAKSLVVALLAIFMLTAFVGCSDDNTPANNSVNPGYSELVKRINGEN